MLGSGLANCIGPQALHDERKIGQRRGISKRLANQTKSAHVKLCTRQGNGITQRSGVRQHTDVFTQPSVEVTFFNCTRFDFTLDKRLHIRSQSAMLGSEEGKLIDELIHISKTLGLKGKGKE